MASYPYYSPPPPPSPPCNNTTSPILLPPPPPSPPPPPPACNHTATPTLSPPQSPPPPAQSPYSHPPPSLSPPPPTSPQKPPQWGPPPSSNYSQPKSPQPPSSPSPPPPSSYAYYSPPPPSSPCNTTTPTLQPPPPPPPACGCNKATPTLPSPPSSRSPPPPSPSHPSPPPPFYHSPPPPPPHRSPPSPPPPSSFPPQLHSPPPPPPHRSPPSPPPPSSFPPPLHSPPPPPSHPPPQSPPPPPFYYSPPPPPPPSSPPSPPPKPSTPSPSPLSPDSPPCHCVCPSPWASPPNYWATPPNYNSIAPAPNFDSPSNGPRTPVLATFVSLGGLFFLSFIVIGLLSMAEKKGMLPFQFSRLLRRYSIPSGGRPEMGPPDLEQPEPSNTSGTDKMSSDPNLRKPPREKNVMELMDAPPDDSVTDTADTSQDVEKAESNEVGEESNDSEKKRRLPKIKKPSRSGAKKRKDKHSGISQVLNTGCRQVLITGCCSDLQEAEQSQDGDKDEDENPEHRNAAEQETKNTKYAQDEGEGSNPVKEESNERSDKPHSNPSETNNTDATQDDAAKEDSNDSKRKLRPPNKGKTSSSVMELMDAPADQSVTDTADTSQDVAKAESNEVGEEPNDSEKKPRLPKIKKPSRSGAKERKDKHSGIRQVLNTGCRQVLNTGCCSDLQETEQSQDGDKDEDENPEQRNAAEQETKNTKSAQDEAEGSNPVKEESNERSDKPHSNPSETNNTDATQDDAAKEASNDSKRKLRLPNEGKASSSRGNPQGKRHLSRFGQLLNAAGNICDGAVQSQKDDNNEAEVQESKLQRDGGDVGEGVESPSDAHEKAEQPNADEQEPDDKPLSNQHTDATQDEAHAAKEDSNDSKTKLRPPNKGKASSSLGNPQGKRQPSRFGQLLNAAGNICHGAVQSQKYDNEEAGGQESEFQHDGGELNLGGSNNANEGEESRSGAHEEESDERPGNPRINQGQSDNREAAQYVEKEPDEGREKSYGLENKSYESGKKSSQTKNPSGRPRGKQKLSEFSPALEGGVFNLGGPNDADEDLESPSNVDDETSDERHRNPLCNQSESDDIDVIQDVEQQSDAVKGRLISSKNKKKHSSRLPGKQKASVVGQVSNAASNLDLDEEVQSQDNDKDEVEVHESEPQHDYKELEVGGTKNDPRGRQARTRARSRGEPLNPNQLMSTGSGNDLSNAMVFLDDEEGKAEELDPLASARGGKQALSEAKVPDLIQTLTSTNVDDSSEELKSVGADNYKDDKAKAHEVKFGGSKKDLRGRQHRTQEREELKLFNLEKVVTTASGSDSGKALVSFDDEDEKVQESEPIASNVDSYFWQPLSSARGIDQSPNLVQNLTATINDDPNVELKSLGDRNYNGKKAEVYELSKDSRRTKGHIMGSRTRIEPPNLDQIVTARMGDDLGKGLESLGGNQFGKSYKDGSNKDVPGSGQTSRGTQQLPNPVQILTATNEDDPNPELEFCEDDKELESEYSNKDLDIQETSPGEIEPSIDDQSVFATVDDDPDVLQFHNNEHDEEPAESNKDARPGKPLSRPHTTSVRGKRRG